MTVNDMTDAAKKATSWIGDFKSFISRGNVVELAVAVAVGAAFTAIVNSLVNDIIMPLVGVVLGGVDFAGLAIQIGDATVAYGNFIQSIITFVIIALVMFWLVRLMNRFWEKEEVAPAGPAPDVVLLTEIRDLLKEQAD
jgi:large conductance mechanosensitive channel